MFIKACIFDLDGVIVDTAKFHYLAWKKLANSLGFDFSEKENEKLKGVSRMDSLDLILNWGRVVASNEQKLEWATQKNEWYLELVKTLTPNDILPGVLPFLADAKQAGMKIGLGSASKNAVSILKMLGIIDQFDVIMDGNHITKGKPDPEIFLKGAIALSVSPNECIVFEDAAEGIKAAIAGGMVAVGIGQHEDLDNADMVVSSFEAMNFENVITLLSNNNKKSK